jgi:hypothetical protein
MIEYGEVSQVKQYIGGVAVRSVVTYIQSVRVDTDSEAVEAFRKLLEQRSRGEVHEPGVTLEEYADTGKVKRIVKKWSVYE